MAHRALHVVRLRRFSGVFSRYHVDRSPRGVFVGKAKGRNFPYFDLACCDVRSFARAERERVAAMMKQPAAPAPDTANLKAAAITSVTMLFYASNDMTCKMVMARLPVPETLAFRNGLTVLGTAAIAGPSALREIATLSRRDAKALLARTSCDITLTTCFLISLAELPLANAAAVLQIVPLIIVLGGAVFFGERVGPVDWLLSMIGFIGALIIIRPGARVQDTARPPRPRLNPGLLIHGLGSRGASETSLI